MSFEHAIDDRYFEDYVEGSVHDCGSIAVEANEVAASRALCSSPLFWSWHASPLASS